MKIKVELNVGERVQVGDIVFVSGKGEFIIDEILSLDDYNPNNIYIEFKCEREGYMYVKQQIDGAKFYREVEKQECSTCCGRGGWMDSDNNPNVNWEDDTWIDCYVCNGEGYL